MTSYLQQHGVINVVISSDNRDKRSALMKAYAARELEINDSRLNEINVGLQTIKDPELLEMLRKEKTVHLFKLNDSQLNEINAAILKTWEDQSAEETEIHHRALSSAPYGSKPRVGYCYSDQLHKVAYYCGCNICNPLF
jgi:hypothetical protein